MIVTGQGDTKSEFQSTLPRGSDAGYNLFRSPTLEFQSTLPRGSDITQPSLADQTFAISIHAPSRERLLRNHDQEARVIISIHAPSRERRRFDGRPSGRTNFNPRSLAGATGWSSCGISVRKHFNPRSLAGATPGGRRFLCNNRAFQSTLPRGSDAKLTPKQARFCISIHAPSRERRRPNATAATVRVISIHAPSRERLLLLLDLVRTEKFQSTLPRGSDP